MADSALACDAGCCVCCVEALSSFCFLKSYGAGSSTSAPCGGPRGCCYSCLENGSDEDNFERAERKEHERRKKRERRARHEKERREEEEEEEGVVNTQPAPASTMQNPSPAVPPASGSEAIPTPTRAPA